MKCTVLSCSIKRKDSAVPQSQEKQAFCRGWLVWESVIGTQSSCMEKAAWEELEPWIEGQSQLVKKTWQRGCCLNKKCFPHSPLTLPVFGKCLPLAKLGAGRQGGQLVQSLEVKVLELRAWQEWIWRDQPDVLRQLFYQPRWLTAVYKALICSFPSVYVQDNEKWKTWWKT